MHLHRVGFVQRLERIVFAGAEVNFLVELVHDVQQLLLTVIGNDDSIHTAVDEKVHRAWLGDEVSIGEHLWVARAGAQISGVIEDPWQIWSRSNRAISEANIR